MGPLLQLAITGIAELTPIVVGLITNKMTVEEAKNNMVKSVEKMHTALQPGGLMDQALATNKQNFDEELAQLEASLKK